MDLVEQLKRDEGCSLKLYTDTAGKATIGVGRNLTDVGISDAEVDFLLANDVRSVQDRLSEFLWYTALDDVRRGAVANMAFNLGVHGLLGFPHMIAALAKQDWVTAADEMANSQWAAQVGARAVRLQTQILTGQWS